MKKKTTHTPVYGVKEFVGLSVTNFELNYLRTGKIEWAEIFLGTSVSKSNIPKFMFSRQGAGMAWAEGQKANLLSEYICLKNSHFWNFCQEIITLTSTIRRGV